MVVDVHASIRVPVTVTCRVLGLLKQAFHAWEKNPVCDRGWEGARSGPPAPRRRHRKTRTGTGSADRDRHRGRTRPAWVLAGGAASALAALLLAGSAFRGSPEPGA